MSNPTNKNKSKEDAINAAAVAAPDERDEKCLPIVEKVYDIINDKRPKVIMATSQEYEAEYDDTIKAVLKVMLDDGLTIGEVNYTLQLVQLRFDNVVKRTAKSVETSGQEMLVKLFGDRQYYDLPLSEVDAVLKGDKKNLTNDALSDTISEE